MKPKTSLWHAGQILPLPWPGLLPQPLVLPSIGYLKGLHLNDMRAKLQFRNLCIEDFLLVLTEECHQGSLPFLIVSTKLSLVHLCLARIACYSDFTRYYRTEASLSGGCGEGYKCKYGGRGYWVLGTTLDEQWPSVGLGLGNRLIGDLVLGTQMRIFSMSFHSPISQ